MGHKLVFGTSVSINLEPESREETKRLFLALAEGGKVSMEPRSTPALRFPSCAALEMGVVRLMRIHFLHALSSAE
jgi:hypothetical protein